MAYFKLTSSQQKATTSQHWLDAHAANFSEPHAMRKAQQLLQTG